MKLRNIPTDGLSPDVLSFLLEAGACNLLIVLQCTKCLGKGQFEGLDCATCVGEGHVPYLLPPKQLLRAVAKLAPAAARRAREAAIAMTDTTDVAKSERAVITPEVMEDRLMCQSLEDHMFYCFVCGLLLTRAPHDRKRKYCNRCRVVMSEFLMQALAGRPRKV